MTRLIAHAGTSESGTVFELQPGSNTIGRAPSNQWVLSDASISSFHAELVVSDIAVLVRDLGSTNGTFIDDQPIKEKIIHRGQTLRLGKVALLFDAEEPVISIPEISKPEIRQNIVCEDGSILCVNHLETLAVWRCTKCELYFCSECVRQVGLQGGRKSTFCQECSGPCEPFTPQPRKKKGKGIFQALGETLRMFKGPK